MYNISLRMQIVVPHFNILAVRCSDYSFIFQFSSHSEERRTFELGGITKTGIFLGVSTFA